MIYDGHAYCIMDPASYGRFEDPGEFRRHLHLAMAKRLSEPTRVVTAWRKRDRAPADSSGLADLNAGWSLGAVKDANFRPAGHGTVEWTIDDEDYAKQVMPTSSVDL